MKVHFTSKTQERTCTLHKAHFNSLGVKVLDLGTLLLTQVKEDNIIRPTWAARHTVMIV